MMTIQCKRFLYQITMLLISFTVAFLVLAVASDSEPECSAVSKIGICPPSLINPADKPCNSNLDCSGNRLCCYSGGSTSKCSDPLQTKGFDCPDQDKIQNGTSCLLDSECPGEEKCCPKSPCSYTCTAPVKNKDLQVDFRQTCRPTVPIDARCPFPPILSSDYVPCSSNSDCGNSPNFNDRMCCPDGNGGRQCTEPFTNREGKCPPSTSIIVDGGSRCMLDTNCPGSQRCCATPLGCLICVQPNITSGQSGCFSVDKLGVCPAFLTNEGRIACNDHSDCPGNRLCCRRSFGTEKRCSDPFSTVTASCPTPGNMQLTQPCLIDQDCSSGSKCCAFTNCSYFCAQASGGQLDPYFCTTSMDKYGACPPAPINPTVYCQSHFECPGRQLCCSNMCSDPLSNKRGTCPSPSQVPRGPSRCFVDGNCSGASNRKCCPDSSCNYYCTYTVL
uniref:WAP domain-containing protein n=1 Tax=Strigamia maritima TaxID=126957 RepID=T1JFE8_STRMM